MTRFFGRSKGEGKTNGVSRSVVHDAHCAKEKPKPARFSRVGPWHHCSEFFSLLLFFFPSPSALSQDQPPFPFFHSHSFRSTIHPSSTIDLLDLTELRSHHLPRNGRPPPPVFTQVQAKRLFTPESSSQRSH